MRKCGKKYSSTGQATDDNMAHTHFMLDTKGCKHTLNICNKYCFSTAAVVARTHLIVTEVFNDFFFQNSAIIANHIRTLLQQLHDYCPSEESRNA